MAMEGYGGWGCVFFVVVSQVLLADDITSNLPKTGSGMLCGMGVILVLTDV